MQVAPSAQDTPESLHLLVPGSSLRAQFDLLEVKVLLRGPNLRQELVVGLSSGRLGSIAHLAGIEVVVDGVSVALVVVLVLGIIVQFLKEAVAGHVPPVVHRHRAALGGLDQPAADAAAAAAQETHVKSVLFFFFVFGFCFFCRTARQPLKKNPKGSKRHKHDKTSDGRRMQGISKPTQA